MVVADTDVIIAALRGNGLAKRLLVKYMPEVYISAVTEMELLVGATNTGKKEAVKQITSTHQILPLSKNIGQEAKRLLLLYNTTSRQLKMPDALIAATCIHHKYRLLTFNTKDYKFIKGLQLVG